MPDNKRTESEILSMEPIEVQLGKEKYKIPVLTVLPTRSWRSELDKALGEIVRNFQPMPEADTNVIAQGLTGALINFPEKVADMLFAYAGESLPKEKILAEASEEQIAIAFGKVAGVGYPFLANLAMMTKVVRATANLPQLDRSMN